MDIQFIENKSVIKNILKNYIQELLNSGDKILSAKINNPIVDLNYNNYQKFTVIILNFFK